MANCSLYNTQSSVWFNLNLMFTWHNLHFGHTKKNYKVKLQVSLWKFNYVFYMRNWENRFQFIYISPFWSDTYRRFKSSMHDDIFLFSPTLFVHRAKEITVLTLDTITRQNLQIIRCITVKFIFVVEISISSLRLIFCFLTLPFSWVIWLQLPRSSKISSTLKWRNEI